MTLGGGDLVLLEHAGVKGMRWGVRKTPAQKAASQKIKLQKKQDKQEYKIASKLTGGEAVASALIAGPVGVLGYKAIKMRAAKTKKKNQNLSGEAQTDAASKLGIGEAVAVTLVSSPLGLVTYAVAKNAAAGQVKDF